MRDVHSTTISARGLTFPCLSAGSGPLVLCLHGFPDSHDSFRDQLPALAARGYHAVAPALRGYAPSCAGELADAHALEAARDVIAIVSALGAHEAFLVGHDWGAVVAYLAAALAPAMFPALCTLSVPHPLGLLAVLPGHPMQLVRSSYMAAFQLDGLAERALAAQDFALVDGLWKLWSPGLLRSPGATRALKDTLAAPGVLPRTLAYYRALRGLAGPMLREVRHLLKKRLVPPVLGLVGSDDGCISAPVFVSAMDARRFSRVETRVLPRAGHFLHLERPDEINEAIASWIDRRGQ